MHGKEGIQAAEGAADPGGHLHAGVQPSSWWIIHLVLRFSGS